MGDLMDPRPPIVWEPCECGIYVNAARMAEHRERCPGPLPHCPECKARAQ